MDRRKYLKTLGLSTVGAGVLLQSCGPEEKKAGPAEATELPYKYDRNEAEVIREKKLLSESFFDDHEMQTIAVLADIIIPKDEISGSATDAKVPEFIAFIVKDMPQHQTPLRGGIQWLDLQCMKRFDNAFVACTPQQQIEMVDLIAYPEKATPEMQQGVAFFNKMRDLTACGFFSSEMGIKDIGYVGNRPNQWDGVPQEVLDQYGKKYDDRTLEISVKFDV